MSVIERHFTAHGFDCIVVLINGNDYRCGYVRVPETHLYHGLHYQSIPVEVHGGLTFSDMLPWLKLDGWWIGFDCAHMPQDKTRMRLGTMTEKLVAMYPDAHWWTEEEVSRECDHLAEQLAGLQPADPGSTYNEARELP